MLINRKDITATTTETVGIVAVLHPSVEQVYTQALYTLS